MVAIAVLLATELRGPQYTLNEARIYTYIYIYTETHIHAHTHTHKYLYLHIHTHLFHCGHCLRPSGTLGLANISFYQPTMAPPPAEADAIAPLLYYGLGSWFLFFSTGAFVVTRTLHECLSLSGVRMCDDECFFAKDHTEILSQVNSVEAIPSQPGNPKP